MLIKVFDLAVKRDCYVQTDAIALIRSHAADMHEILIAGDTCVVDDADRDRLLSPVDGQRSEMHVSFERDNGEMDARFERASKAFWAIMGEAAPAAQKTTPATVVSMTRDETKSSRSPFWRCATGAGFMVNVFQHADPLKDNFNLFESAGYGPEMLAMNTGDTITWERDPVAVELVPKGDFWNVVAVQPRPSGALPDEPEPEDESEDDDER